MVANTNQQFKVETNKLTTYPRKLVVASMQSNTTVGEVLLRYLDRNDNHGIYIHGNLLRPGQTLAAGGVHNGDILETCSNPEFSANLHSSLK